MLKPSITVGRDKEGKLSVLYIGKDAQEAVDAMLNAPAGIVEIEVYRKPFHFKRRVVDPVVESTRVDEAPLNEAPVESPGVPEVLETPGVPEAVESVQVDDKSPLEQLSQPEPEKVQEPAPVEKPKAPQKPRAPRKPAATKQAK